MPRRGERRVAAAAGHWRRESPRHPSWDANSHWREVLGDESWLDVGEDHLAIFQVFARALDRVGSLGTVLEWGCGGGANALAFAPRAERFIGADSSEASLLACERQVRAVCATPVETRRIDVAHPERAAAGLEQSCSTFLCLPVELTIDPAAMTRILRIAQQVLVSGGIALVRVRYHTGARAGLPSRRNLATTTTFTVEEFWELAQRCDLVPTLITLVPKNRLDVRYAYYALGKP